MKLIIIGLGSFGASLARKMSEMGHEVIGVDRQMSKVDAYKEVISHTICLDSTDEQAVAHLPLSDSDIVVVCIGEDEGANVMTTALMKKLNVKRLISRAVNPLHETVLEAMGVKEIVHPEEEAADRWTKKFNLIGVEDSFDISGEFSIIEIKVPDRLVGQTIDEIGFRSNHNVVVLTTIKTEEKKNLLGVVRTVRKAQGVASAKTTLEKGDIMVLYGKTKDIETLMKE